jgi:subtilisin family serine protease
MKNNITRIAPLLLFTIQVLAQKKDVSAYKPEYLNWYNTDLKSDRILGTSVNKTYQELLTNKIVKKEIIVAVIDGGVDIEHLDLKGKIWVNEKEIPGNKIDDDHNGYVDDIHGWNFIGNANGENIHFENFEFTRIFKAGGTDENFQKAKKLQEETLAKKQEEKANIEKFEARYMAAKLTVKNATGIEVNSLNDLKTVSSTIPGVEEAVSFLKERYEQGFTEKSFLARKQRNADALDKQLNVNFDPRKIIGDNPNDITDNKFGNPDVTGPRANHGTSVAGIIAALRDNGIGINGIATHVKIMVLRTTPGGDERDKDVALAIKYAVENGASIINMSFGKALSPQKQFVDDAIKLAEQKNVLVIHAAGNSGENTTEHEYFPSDRYIDRTEASNFLNVGASTNTDDESVAAIFSNYGKLYVDLFAPGESIISLDTSNAYDVHSGTSEAAPVVSGIAALILSYYPELTPKELISILMESSYKIKSKVLIPDLINEKREKIKFTELSKSGGIVNAYEAMQLAEKRTVK